MDALAKLSKEDQLVTPLEAVTVDPSNLLPVPVTLSSLCTLPLTPALLDSARRLSSDRRLRHVALSPRNFSVLPVTLHHLSWLCDALCSYDLHLHAGVCMTLAHLLSELAPGSPTPCLPLLTRTRRARLLTSLGQSDKASSILQAPSAVPLGLDNALVQQFLGDVEERERQLAARRAAGRPAPPRSEDDEITIKGFDTRVLWAALAEEATLLGQPRVALEYLTAATRHNEAYEDEKNSAYCDRTRALLEAIQGRDQEAVDLLLSSVQRQEHVSSEPSAWARATCLLAELLIRREQEAEAERLLSKACSALLAKVTPPSQLTAGISSASHNDSSHGGSTTAMPHSSSNNDTPPNAQEDVAVDAALAWAQCATCLARLLAQRALKQVGENEIGPPLFDIHKTGTNPSRGWKSMAP
jgi:tetratricopeptide (TPR) repeat protein